MNTDHEIMFGTLSQDGAVTEERRLLVEDIQKCPHRILVPEHYRENGTCRCDDPAHAEMGTWGYTWDGRSWN